MATYTFADLHIPDVAHLADLNGILDDLRDADEFANMLGEILADQNQNRQFIHPLSIAILISYSRPFLGGVRSWKVNEYLDTLTFEQRTEHDFLIDYRNKHIAHSVNGLEKNLARANYCKERVHEEGITSISCSSSKVVGLSRADINTVIELSRLHCQKIRLEFQTEATRLLPIVRGMPIEQVLAGGQKAHTINVKASIAKSRKR